jgi:catechol 2,3-dioxygenase-like lactoylglutathione lyase family enzyme
MDISTLPILSTAGVATRLPAQDLDRARAWYRDRLGLEPTETREGGLRYVLGSGEFVVFASAGASSGTHTQAAFDVADLDVAIRELRNRGVVLDTEGMAGLEMVDGVVTVPGNYPSKGTAERGAWFRDSENNLLGIAQSLDPPAGGAANVGPAAVAVALLDGWQRADRPAVERLLADEFTFFSPQDAEGLDRDGYFARCWPDGERLRQEEVEADAIGGGVVAMRYVARRGDGTRFRNTELVTVRDRQVTQVDVYFGREVAAEV